VEGLAEQVGDDQVDFVVLGVENLQPLNREFVIEAVQT